MTCQEAIDVMGEAVEGRLSPDVRPSFDDHMGECRPCSTYFEQLCVTRGALRSLPRMPDTDPRRSRLIEAFRKQFRKRDDR